MIFKTELDEPMLKGKKFTQPSSPEVFNWENTTNYNVRLAVVIFLIIVWELGVLALIVTMCDKIYNEVFRYVYRPQCEEISAMFTDTTTYLQYATSDK